MTAPAEPDFYNRGGGYPLLTDDDMHGADPERHYFPDKDLIRAANVALACGLPLLLTGEAGCGKTDFAFAAANQLAKGLPHGRDGSLLEFYVRSDTRATDLLYQYDAVRRFSDAQLRASNNRSTGRATVDVPDDHAGEYIRLAALGVALTSPYRRVVLIDEIDKAPRDLPSDLLRPLEKYSFDIPEIAPGETWRPTKDGDHRPILHSTMGLPQNATKPLVIITSNEDRQLPDPFLRRCVFYHIQFPSPETLARILKDQFAACDKDQKLTDKILRVFLALREPALALAKKPSTAELIVWTIALTSVFARGVVDERLEATCRRLDEAGAESAALRDLQWSQVPGLTCLVKLREDLATLNALGRDGAG